MKEPGSSYTVLYKLLTIRDLRTVVPTAMPAAAGSFLPRLLEHPLSSATPCVPWPMTPEPSAAFWAGQVDSSTAGKAVHATPAGLL